MAQVEGSGGGEMIFDYFRSIYINVKLESNCAISGFVDG